ncbi:MAG: hypothetical protein LUC22_06585, partial [Prevotella sp.]|nr:hypothetical protein [Prevotella sp.]
TYTASGDTGVWDGLAESVTLTAGSSTAILSIDITSDATNTLTVAAPEGYGTFFTDTAFIMPDGVTGATITDVSEDASTLTINWVYTPGTVVPACTPLLLRGEGESVHTYKTVSSTEAAPEQLLCGSTTDTTTTAPGGEVSGYRFFMLTYDSTGTKIGFYYSKTGGAAFTSLASKAWLAIEKSRVPVRRGFPLGEKLSSSEPAKETVETEGKETIYTPQGTRVTDTTRKGIYIVNGRKVVVR